MMGELTSDTARSLEGLKPGQKGKISSVRPQESSDLHRLLSLGMVPGTVIELIQRFPTFVVQVNESQLAFDESIARVIFVDPF